MVNAAIVGEFYGCSPCPFADHSRTGGKTARHSTYRQSDSDVLPPQRRLQQRHPDAHCEGGQAPRHTSLRPKKNPVWESLRAFWAALTMASPDRRYPFFWMGLESLFGSDDTNEISYKL